MRQALSITISVFVKPEEPPDHDQKCVDAIKILSGLDLEREKLQIATETAEGFSGRKMHIHSLKLTKESHTNTCLSRILELLNHNQIELLRRQKESRLDEDMNFYLRLGKEELLRDDTYITDSGDCFHIKISLAAFPRKRAPALELLDNIFDKYLNNAGP